MATTPDANDVAPSRTSTLDADSLTLLRDIDRSVSATQHLRCARVDWDFLLHANAPPQLSVDIDRFINDDKLELLMHTVARLQQHSHTLRTYPARKAAFWEAVLTHSSRPRDIDEQMGGRLERWMFEHDAFPHIVLNFHHHEITATRLDILLAFLTATSVSTNSSTVCGTCDSPALLPAIGLRFTQCAAFSTQSLVLLRTFFDALFAHPQRRFAVGSLNLSSNQMDTTQLQLLNELLQRNARVYRIKRIVLNDIFFSRARESDEADAIAALLKELFAAPSLSLLQTRYSSDRSTIFTPQVLSFDHSSLRLQHFAAMCSSWRYGCAVHELSLLSTLNRVSAVDRQQCWRWLAFGLFYPRSKRAARAFKLVRLDLSRIELRVADAKAFERTLRDPAGELVFNGSRPASDCRAFELPTLRTFHDGAQFYEHARESSPCIAMLSTAQAFEVLVTPAATGSWVCVVYPGVGLAWTPASSMLLPSCSTSDNADDDTAYESENEQHLYELTAFRLSSKKAPITTLIECIGHRLRLLSLKYNTVDLATIHLHCVHLRHLDIEGCHVQDSCLEALVRGRHTHFVQHQLESLNLSDMPIRDVDVRSLCELLSSKATSLSTTNHPVQLRELRLVVDMNESRLDSISAMLAANKSLEVLELPRIADVPQVDAIERRHQYELLAIQQSRQTKSALLSVLFDAPAAKLSAARRLLDADSITAILTFAGTPVVRHILWRGSLMGDGDDD